ncbi:hypothetical protein [Pseudomonas sp. 37 R 15]|nr:hypothetical protein [Pseudomonas sp. 37 R 15]
MRNRQALLHRRVGQQQPRAAVLHHVQQAITRVFDVQRHVHATGLQHREERHHDLGTARHGNRHAHFRADATRNQCVGQAVGLGVELSVTEGLRIELHRHRIRSLPGTVGDQLMHQPLGRVAGIGAVPQLQDVLLLVLIQHAQLADGLSLIGHHRLQQVLPMPGHARDGGGRKQVGSIAQGGMQRRRAFFHVQRQVELGHAVIPAQDLDVQVGQLLQLTLGGRYAVVEQHLEQRAQAEAAFRMQRLHQLFERQVLMGLGVQGALAHLAQQLLDAHLPVKVSLEHLGVDEETNQTLGFQAVAVGNRHADAHIFLATVAMQQRLVGRQQHHRQGDAGVAGQGAQAFQQTWRQVDAQARTAMAWQRRAREVERQLQHRLLAAQLFTPIGQLTRLLAGLHPVALPYGIVGVLDRQRRQIGGVTLAERGVQLHQFFDHQLHRPAIGDDVVLHQHQHVVVLGQAQQRDPQQRPAQ